MYTLKRSEPVPTEVRSGQFLTFALAEELYALAADRLFSLLEIGSTWK